MSKLSKLYLYLPNIVEQQIIRTNYQAVLIEKKVSSSVFYCRNMDSENVYHYDFKLLTTQRRQKKKSWGACIYLRNDLEFLEIPELNHIERNESQQAWVRDGNFNLI